MIRKPRDSHVPSRLDRIKIDCLFKMYGRCAVRGCPKAATDWIESTTGTHYLFCPKCYTDKHYDVSELGRRLTPAEMRSRGNIPKPHIPLWRGGAEALR